MKLQNLKYLFTSKTYFTMNVASIFFVAGFLAFEAFIHWDPAKVPGDPAMFFRDFLWLFYWRWNLDYLIFPMFLAVVVIECVILRKAMERGARRHVLGTYVVPAITFAFSFLYMLAIDLAVTWFADTAIDGNWDSEAILFLGFTAKGLYHQFFFWFIPAVMICAICMQTFIRINSYTEAFRTLLVCYAFYCLNLGFLDPLVCQLIGLTPQGSAGGWYWASFGDWAMGGADAIWAVGWITHYSVFAAVALVGVWILARIKREILMGMEGTLPREKLWKQKRALVSIILTIGFLGWFSTLIPWLM